MKPAAALICLLSLATAHADAASLLVDAGAHERQNVTVTFILPADAARPTALTRAGRLYPVQVARDNVAAVILDRLDKNERARFSLVTAELAATAAATPSAGGVRIERDGTRWNVFRPASPANAQPQRLFSYQAEPGSLPRTEIKDAFRRGGYLHPIFAPSGQAVTDDFPPNHVHHHGIWWAWTHTEFQGRKPDFWNMGDNKGRVEFVGVDDSWSGPVHAGFRSRHRFVDMIARPPVTALEESWTVTAYAAPADRAGSWMFDLVSEQHCATSDALRLPEYRYGGVGLRGNWAWNGRTNAAFLTSNGETDRVKGHATRARWCDLSGLVDGRRVGITIFGHPANFRFPEPMRLHPDEPFFNFAPQQAGDMEIKPGDKYISRYRFVVHDGAPVAVELERLWNDFAHPPTASLTAKD